MPAGRLVGGLGLGGVVPVATVSSRRLHHQLERLCLQCRLIGVHRLGGGDASEHVAHQGSSHKLFSLLPDAEIGNESSDEEGDDDLDSHAHPSACGVDLEKVYSTHRLIPVYFIVTSNGRS